MSVSLALFWRCEMDRLCAKLILFSEIDKDAILFHMADIFRDLRDARDADADAGREELTGRVYHEVKRLLDISTDYGFDGNLWQNYLTYLLITDENSFTLTAEGEGAKDGSVNIFAKNDFSVFMELFHYDFSKIEETLGIDCFTTLTHYRAIGKKERMYNRGVSEKVRALSDRLAASKDVEEFFTCVTDFYRSYGFGMIGLNKAFRIRKLREHGDIEIYPINNMDEVMLEDLVGYESQKQKLIENTEAFIEGLPANNCLLYGDSGTGKSTCIKAIINRYYDKGLRMIEIYKHQFKELGRVIAKIKNRNYRFIIYMDDLSFEEFETEYKFLKAVIEGGVESKPDNVLIYATSNRRHLIREVYSDRNDMEVSPDMHRSDTMQEKLSLVNRFGVTIAFHRPDKKEFNHIVSELYGRIVGAEDEGRISEEELLFEANRWELAHGGLSGRTAEQFVRYITAKYSMER